VIPLRRAVAGLACAAVAACSGPPGAAVPTSGAEASGAAPATTGSSTPAPPPVAPTGSASAVAPTGSASPVAPTGSASPAGTPLPETFPAPETFPTPSQTPVDPVQGGLSTTAWTRGADTPVALSEVGAARLGGQVWVAGGLTADGDAVTTVQVYDPTFDSWSVGPELPEAVHHAALVSTGRELYLIGGYAGPGFDTPTDAVRRLDPAAGGWADAPGLPQPRAAGAGAWDGARVVYGGGVTSGGLAGDVVALAGDAWQTVGALAVPREHLAAANDRQGRVWFLGGRTGGLDTNVGTVDLVRDGEVSRLGELPTPRGGVGAFWSPQTGACLVGGEEPEGTLAAVECIDGRGTVTALPPLQEPRHGLGAVVVEGVAYAVLGGPEPGLVTSGTVEALLLVGE
jgi:non-specific serine/threonine protein kinase